MNGSFLITCFLILSKLNVPGLTSEKYANKKSVYFVDLERQLLLRKLSDMCLLTNLLIKL